MRGGLQQGLAGDGQAEPADAVGIDVRARLQEGDGGVVILLGRPPEGVGIAVAATLAALVEEQDAVAVAPSMRACSGVLL